MKYSTFTNRTILYRFNVPVERGDTSFCTGALNYSKGENRMKRYRRSVKFDFFLASATILLWLLGGLLLAQYIVLGPEAFWAWFFQPW